MDAVSHRLPAIDQFSRQAVPFANLPGHSSSLGILTEPCRPSPSDEVLDVAQPQGTVAGYDEIELRRDPSHVHAPSRTEFARHFESPILEDVRFSEYKCRPPSIDISDSHHPLHFPTNACQGQVTFRIDRPGATFPLDAVNAH